MTSTDHPQSVGGAQTLTLPAPAVADPAAAPALRWAVISPGHIADQFTSVMHRATAGTCACVM